MQFLLLTNKPPFPPHDGGAIATFNLANGYANHNHLVDVLAIKTKKHPYNSKEILPGQIHQNISIKTVFVNTSINILKALINYLFSNRPYIAVRFNSKKYSNELKTLLKKNNYNIIQLEGLYMCQYIPVIKKYSNSKIVFRSHNIEHEIWERVVITENILIKKVYLKNMVKRIRNFEIKVLNSYNLLVPITSRDAEKYISYGLNIPYFVFPVGIEIDKFKNYEANIEYPSIFFIGSLDWIPNQEGLLWFINNVWPQLNDKFINLKFFIAGRNAPENIKNIVNKSSNIVFLGEVEDAYEYMSSKAIMIVPLFSGSGMRVKIIEGMALGKAIVSTSIGSEGIAVANNEHLLIADSETEFLNSITSLLENKQKFELICDKAKKFAKENYDNNIITSELINFFNKNN